MPFGELRGARKLEGVLVVLHRSDHACEATITVWVSSPRSFSNPLVRAAT